MKMKMVKLIDTEILKAYVRKHGLYCDTETDREATCKIIDAMPGVHAIPLKWLKDQIKIASSNGEDDYVNAIEWTVMCSKCKMEWLETEVDE